MSTGQQRNERVIRVGVIGLGGAAVGMLAKFTKAPRFQVTAVADIDPEILARFHADSPETALFNSADDLCTQGEVDLVYISTPTHWHVEHARAAMSNGKHVVTEKPLALSLEDADAIIADSARYGVLLGVNVPISFEPLAQKLREVVVSGEFGKLRMVHHWRYHDWLYRPRSSGELTPEAGSGLLWRDGPHQLDLLRTIAGGLVRSVRGYVGMWDAERRVPGAYVAYIDFEDGTVVTAVNNGYDHFQSSEFVFGSDEGVSYAAARQERLAHGADEAWENGEAKAERFGGIRAVDRSFGRSGRQGGGWILGGPLVASFDYADVRMSGTGLTVYGNDGRTEISVPHSDMDGRNRRIDDFYDAIVEGRPLHADGPWSKATLELIMAIEESSEQRREVVLSHQTPFLDS